MSSVLAQAQIKVIFEAKQSVAGALSTKFSENSDDLLEGAVQELQLLTRTPLQLCKSMIKKTGPSLQRNCEQCQRFV